MLYWDSGLTGPSPTCKMQNRGQTSLSALLDATGFTATDDGLGFVV